MPDSMSVAAGSKVRRLALCIGAAALMLTACGKKTPADPPRADVSTVTVAPQAATVFTDYVAQTEAVNTVEIRPRVGGVLEKQLPIEGQRVKIGALLFVIDQQPYIAALAQAKAALAQSEAALVQSRRGLGRAKSLSEIDAVIQEGLAAAGVPDLSRRRLRIPAAAPAELHRSGSGSAHRHPGDPPGSGQSRASVTRRAVRAGTGGGDAIDGCHRAAAARHPGAAR